MREPKHSERSESIGDMDMNIEAILNEDDDFDMPIIKNTKANKIPITFTAVEPQQLPLLSNARTNSSRSPHAKFEENRCLALKKQKSSEIYMRNWNSEDQKTPFGDSKMVIFHLINMFFVNFHKIAIRNYF